ncbi:MAG: hypothetical protein FWG50_08560 [Kiritimatiellaeota bacterium]|nr:hypothetical protein [Kiritimatiellota bacterium]
MNLSRSLKWAMACAGMIAGTASAQTLVSDTFAGQNADTLANDLVGWQSIGANDVSKLVDMGQDFAWSNVFFATSNPLTNSTDSMVLELNTEGDTLQRSIAGADFTADPIYIDMMVKFVLSEDEPDIPSGDVKTLIFANASSNLVVYSSDGVNIYGFSELAGPGIDPEQWYRLTLTWFNWEDAGGLATMKIQLNGGEYLTGALGFNEEFGTGAYNFVSAASVVEDTTLSFIEFQGTGFIDELVVTYDEPEFGDSIDIPGTYFASDTGRPVDPQDLAKWLQRYNVMGAEQPGMFDAFLLNADPYADTPDLMIMSIEQDGADSIITIGVGDGAIGLPDFLEYADESVPPEDVLYPNGRLFLTLAETLGDLKTATPVQIDLKNVNAGSGITVDHLTGKVTVPMGANKFIRAKVIQ